MKVANVTQGNNVQQVQGVAAEKADAASAAKRSEAAVQKPADKVSFNKFSSKLAELETTSGGAAPERLEQLKSLIESGKYQVPASEIASRMVNFYSRA